MAAAPYENNTEKARDLTSHDHIAARSPSERDSEGLSGASNLSCASLVGEQLKSRFNAEQGEALVYQAVVGVASQFMLKETAPEFAGVSYSRDYARELGEIAAISALLRLSSSCETSFERYLCIVSDAIYYDPFVHSRLEWIGGTVDMQLRHLAKLLDYLPEEVGAVVARDYLIGSTTNGRDFALLFMDPDRPTRRIVANDRLIQLSDVEGYKYLDISPTGRPFARCMTSRGGGRAFFDGERLMAHPSFQTCAPQVEFFDGGYIVNSTVSTIINGMMYPLLSRMDSQVVRTGIEAGLVDLSGSSALAPYVDDGDVARQLLVDGHGAVRLNGELLRPLGVFKPCEKRLCENGFTEYEWSEFVPL